jgi:HNH endonuclease
MTRRKRSFDELTDKTGDCWLWVGERRPNGYGRFYLGFFNGKITTISAHRYAWQRANRPLLPGEVIRHICDNPPCVRPDHLLAGSHRDNVHDAIARGRITQGFRKGEKHLAAKLHDTDIPQIRSLLDAGVSQRKIADQFGVNPSQISRIAAGVRWRHL